MYLHLIREAKSKGNGGRSRCNPFCTADSACRYAYDFDDIGNREARTEFGTNHTYTANSLNQYAMVGRVVSNAPQEEFIPQFDDDGNQTLIKTTTGIWQVQYNGENRPILWSQGTNMISMSYDRQDRRVTKNNQRFVYDGYLQIADNNGNAYVWDPTEKVATRPLAWLVLRSLGEGGYYTHDGNKNVSEVVFENGEVIAHYEYAPFGATTVQHGSSALENLWRFSCEYADDETEMLYYNFRHYNPTGGRWTYRDPIDAEYEFTYMFVNNEVVSSYDVLGLRKKSSMRIRNRNMRSRRARRDGQRKERTPIKCCINGEEESGSLRDTGVYYYCMYGRKWYYPVSYIVRPFSPEQRGLVHCWFRVVDGTDEYHFGAYPNSDVKYSIADELSLVEDGFGHANDEEERGGTVPSNAVQLSPCLYDIYKFRNCILDKYRKRVENDFDWTFWNNCADFVFRSIKECKDKSKRNYQWSKSAAMF